MDPVCVFITACFTHKRFVYAGYVNLVSKYIKDYKKYTEPNARYGVLRAVKMYMLGF